MWIITVWLTSLLSGLGLSRITYLAIRDVKKALLGPNFKEDSGQLQAALLFFGSVSAITGVVFAQIEGASIFLPVIIMPIVFTIVAEMRLALQSLSGPTLENFILKYHPVDFLYGLLKQTIIAVLSQKVESDDSRCDLPSCETPVVRDAPFIEPPKKK
jgi:hypothetical protein